LLSVPFPSLPPASPETLALSAVWATLLDLALAALVLFWAIDAFAPPQDLPWKPLRLADPPGLATRLKFERAAADRQACRAILREGGVAFAEVPSRAFGTCAQTNAVRLTRGVTPLSPPAPVMTCPEALAYAFWDRHTLRPAAREELRGRVTAVEHYGTYACRNIYHRKEGVRSEHAFANALDVAAFRLEGGGRASVVKDFRDDGARGRFLRRVRTGACDWFRAVLSPDYNAAHRDHLHLDRGRYRACR
jgi:hypothetical protein